MRETDILIIGGGITGLSLGSFLGESDYLILEKDLTPGGYCKTTISGKYVWDYSGHFFHFKSEEIRDYVTKNIKCKILEVEKISHIYYGGKMIDFPFQDNIHQLDKDEFIECLTDLYHAGNGNSNNFKEYVISNLGKSICDKFVIPYNEKLYACDLNQLDHDSMGRFFPSSVKFGDLLDSFTRTEQKKSYNSHFIYPEFGSYEFVKSILQRIPEDKILTGTRITSLDLENKIAYTNKGEVKFKKLVSTLSFNTLLEITNKPSKDLSCNKVAVFNLGFDKGTKIKSHWIYFPGSEIFYRVGFYNNILGSNQMSLYVEIGLKSNQELPSEHILLNAVIQDLRNSGIIEDQVLVDHQFLVMNPAYVHITEESKKMYNDWSSTYNPDGIYSIGRYGSWTYCSIEDNVIQAQEISKKLL
jgi:protoporphyrinogen oxidase